jgi:predicted phage terminase large subunit-like protein
LKQALDDYGIIVLTMTIAIDMRKPAISVTLPPLHRAQAEIVASPARFKVVSCGRRFGKTRLAVLVSIAEMLQGGSVMWVAPSFDKAMIGWRLIEEITRQMPFCSIHRAERRITASNGGWLGAYSADSEGGLRGEGASLVVVDEAAHMRNFNDIWKQELRPALTDRKGRAMFISTPRGFNHFYELFIQERNFPGEWQSWQYPTAANPYMDEAEIEAARRVLPDLYFRQEYLGEFVQLSGAMFRREWFEVVDSHPPLAVQARHWDLAATQKTSGDYSAGVRVGLDDDGNAYVLDMVHDRLEWPALLRLITQTALADGADVQQSIETAGVQKGLLDLLLAEPALASTAVRGIQPVGDKITRANAWLARAEQGKVKLMRGAWNQTWLDEICAFPEAEHDDIVDATSGAFTAIGQSRSVFVWYGDEDTDT